MVLRDLVGDVLRTLWAHKLRTFLTMFGIAWGIVSIVLMVAAGEGLRKGQEDQARNLGKDILIVFHGRTSTQVGGARAGRWAEAGERLHRAKVIFHEGHMIWDLGRLLLTESLFHLRQSKFDIALKLCEQALDHAARCDYRLIHADALNLRASVILARCEPRGTDARDDAETALGIAEQCGYAWAAYDAVEVLAGAHRTLGNERQARDWQERAKNRSHRLKRKGSG